MLCVAQSLRHINNNVKRDIHTMTTDAELGLEGYVMFRKDRIGRRG